MAKKFTLTSLQEFVAKVNRKGSKLRGRKVRFNWLRRKRN